MRGDRRCWALFGVVALAVPAGAQAAEPTAVWVFFTDKGLEEHEVEDALVTRAAELSPRALERRQRYRGDAGVDERDLPPAPSYVASVAATGARERAHSRWLNAISVAVTPEQSAAIAKLPFVAKVQPVARERRTLPIVTPPASGGDGDGIWGVARDQLDMIDVPYLHECGLNGEGVLVGVLDTGFRVTHEAFQHLDVVAEHDFINDDDVVDNEAGDPSSQFRHGTWVLSLLAGWDANDYSGAAPGISVLLAKTEDTSQEEPIEEDWYVEGLEWIEGMGADMSTASLGYFAWYTADDMDGQTGITTQAAVIATSNGLIMFNSMGNSGPGPTTMGAPADADVLLSIGAVQPDGVIAGFSSRGPTADGRTKPDVCAPGNPTWVASSQNNDSYGQGSGTSFAAPLAAGVGALLKQAYPNLDPVTMGDLLRSTASQAAMPDDDYGWGIIDGETAAGLYCTCIDVDEDGFFDELCGGTDCDDENGEVNPDATEACNGYDDNCDLELFEGEDDADEDGVTLCGGDCDDENPAVNPELDEVCDDALDNDCNDLVDDEDPACQVGTTGTEGGTSNGDSASATGPSTTDASSGTGDTSDSEDDGTTSGQATDSGCGCSTRSRSMGFTLGSFFLLALMARRRRSRS